MVLEGEKLKIKIVNLGNLYSRPIDPEEPEIIEIANKFGDALHTHGFTYVSHHGIPQDLIDKAFEVSTEYFGLSPNIKEKYLKKDPLKNYHGYARPGMELLNDDSAHEVRESYDIIQQNRYYPTEELPHFQTILESLEEACRSLMKKLLKLLAIKLELDDLNFFCKAAQNLYNQKIESTNTLRTLYYPSLLDLDSTSTSTTSKGGTIRRCAEHTDWGILTMLWQDCVGGLQVQGKSDGTWMDIEPIPGTAVVNTGDMLEGWTGKYFPAALHRVLVPDDQRQRQMARQSVAYFVLPDNDVLVSPIQEGILKDRVNQFKPITARNHFLKQASKAYGIN